MKHSAIRRTVSLMLGLCMLCQLLIGLISCGASEESVPVTEITSVTLNKSGEKITIGATLSGEDASRYKNATLCLFALEPFETVSAVENGRIEPVAESRSSETMRFTVDFSFANGMKNRLCQRFLLAQRDENGVYSVLTDGVYLSNPEVLASGAGSTESDALKGLAVSVGDDTSALSPSHTVIDLPIEQYVYASPVKGDTLSYTYAGATLSLSRSAVEALDEQIRALAAQGSAVYLRPILTAAPDTLEELSALGYAGSAEASAYAFNLENEQGFFLISGFFSFLAARYASVAGVIPGYALNEAEYASSSAADFESYMNGTLTLMRVVYNIFRSVNSSVQICLPVSNLFTTDGALGATEQGTREFLGAFASYAKRTGDFDWSLYLLLATPTATSETLYAESGTVNRGDVTEKYILPQTLPLLLELLATEGLCFNGAQRDMIWGVSVSGTGDGENQRLSLLYTYAKALAHNKDRASGVSAVRAVIWETLSDSEGVTSGLLAADGTEKPSGRLFAALGRTDFSKIVNLTTAESRLGTKYAEIEPVLSNGGERMTVVSGQAEGTETLPENTKSQVLFGDGSAWADCFAVLPGSGVLSSYRTSYGDPTVLLATFEGTAGNGVYTERLSGKQFGGGNKFALTLTAALPEGNTAARLLVTLESSSGDKSLRYEGEGTVTDGVWSTMVFDIEAFSSELKDDAFVTLTVSLPNTHTSEEAPASLYLSRVESYETRSWFARGGWIVIVVLAVIVLGLVGGAVWVLCNFDIHWHAGGTREKNQKSDISMKERIGGLWSGLAAKLMPSPRPHARILVKPEQNPAEDSRGFDDEDFSDTEDPEALFEEHDDALPGDDTDPTPRESDGETPSGGGMHQGTDR